MAATKNLMEFESNNAITCTLASLANASSRESAVIDNSTDKRLDRPVSLTFTIASGSPATAGPYVNVYAAASFDGTRFPITQKSDGTPYTTGAGDASVGALSNPNSLRLIGTFGFQSTTSNAERTFRTEPMSIAAAFGGNMPKKVSIIVENQTGVAFSSSTATTANLLEETGLETTSGNT